jgi:hypothetical protein
LASNTPIFRLEKKKWYLVDTKNKITGTIIYRGAISIKQDQAFEYIELI